MLPLHHQIRLCLLILELDSVVPPRRQRLPDDGHLEYFVVARSLLRSLQRIAAIHLLLIDFGSLFLRFLVEHPFLLLQERNPVRPKGKWHGESGEGNGGEEEVELWANTGGDGLFIGPGSGKTWR